MRVLLAVLTAVIALLHLWFLTLEMFLWQRPLGLATSSLATCGGRFACAPSS